MLASMLMPRKKLVWIIILPEKPVIVNLIVTFQRILVHSISKLAIIFQLKVYESSTFTVKYDT